MPGDLGLSETHSLGMVLIATPVDQMDGTLEWCRDGSTVATITLGRPQ